MAVVLRGVKDLPELEAFLDVPAHAGAVVLFAHGSGSSRHSPRNNYVARVLRSAGLATLLVDLLTEEEDAEYARRFEIGLLTQRLHGALEWLGREPGTRELPVGLFGASTGAAAALQLAALAPGRIGAVVSRGGRPDLAGDESLARVRAPTLLVVGGDDAGVIELNESAYERLRCVSSPISKRRACSASSSSVRRSTSSVASPAERSSRAT